MIVRLPADVPIMSGTANASRRLSGSAFGAALIGASGVQYGERLATFNRGHYPGITLLTLPDR